MDGTSKNVRKISKVLIGISKIFESLTKTSKDYRCFSTFLGHLEKPKTSKFKSSNSQKRLELGQFLGQYLGFKLWCHSISQVKSRKSPNRFNTLQFCVRRSFFYNVFEFFLLTVGKKTDFFYDRRALATFGRSFWGNRVKSELRKAMISGTRTNSNEALSLSFSPKSFQP